MNEPLQAWYCRWLRDNRGTDLTYANPKEPSLSQVHFVRDRLAHLFWKDHDYDGLPLAPRRTWWEHNPVTGVDVERTSDGDRDLVRVVGEHSSKSVALPVYCIRRPDLDLTVVMRDNFHDWNVTVLSGTPVGDWVGTYGVTTLSPEDRARYVKGGYWDYLFFQGFPDEYCLGPWDHDPRAFSIALGGGEHELYAFCRQLTMPIRDLPRKRGYQGVLNARGVERLAGVQRGLNVPGQKVHFRRHIADPNVAMDVRIPYGDRLGDYVLIEVCMFDVEAIR